MSTLPVAEVEGLEIWPETCDSGWVAARAGHWADNAAEMPADGVVIAKEGLPPREQTQAYQGEEVASYAQRKRFGCGTSTSTCRSLRRSRPGQGSDHHCHSGHNSEGIGTLPASQRQSRYRAAGDGLVAVRRANGMPTSRQRPVWRM